MTWQQTHRLVATVLAVSLLAIVPGISVNLIQRSTPVPLWWDVICGGLFIGVTALMVVTACLALDPALGSRLLVACAAVTLASYPLVAHGTPSGGAQPWITIVVPSAVGACAIAWGTWAAAMAAAAIVGLRALAESFSTWPVPNGVKVVDIVFPLALFLAVLVAIEAAYSSTQRVESARQASVNAFAKAAAHRAEAAEILRWDSLTHDSVLSALAIGGRHPQSAHGAWHAAEARRLAESALAQLAGDIRARECSTAELSDRIVREVRSVVPTAEVRVSEDPAPLTIPGDAAAAIVAAAVESARNAVRHGASGHSLLDPPRRTGAEGGGPPPVWVDISSGADAVDVRVTDGGRGFNPSRIPSDRLGLLVSVIGRMEAVGGSASITSAVGQGTTVALQWVVAPRPGLDGWVGYSADPTIAEHLAKAEHERSETLRTASLLAGSLWLALHAALALSTLSQNHQPAVDILALALCLAVGGWGMLPLVGRPVAMTTAQAWAFCAVAGLLGLLVGPFIEPADLGGYANWPAGATSMLVAILVLRGRVLQAVLADVLTCLVIALPFLTAGSTSGGSRIGTVSLLWVGPLAWLVASLGARMIFDRTDRAVARYFATIGEARVRAAELRSTMTLALVRRDELTETAKPLLERLAARDVPLDDGFAADCRSAERQLRDSLRARALVDDRLRKAVESARSRGVSVAMRDDRTDTHREVTEPVRCIVAAALQVMVHGDITLRLPPQGPTLTVVVVDDPAGVARLADELSAVAARVGLDIAIDAGEGDLLAEIRETGGGQPSTGRAVTGAPRRPAADDSPLAGPRH